jgi:hypothetical protein
MAFSGARRRCTGSAQSALPAPAGTTVGQPPALALEPDILSCFAGDLRSVGVAGEERLAKLIYLAVTSRVLPWGRPGERPVSVIPRGTSSSGKSHTVRTTLRFFTDSAYVNLGSMSKRYLLYMEETLSHRVVYVPELASLGDDEEIMAALRTLLSEGRLIHGTVDRESNRRTARPITKEGPTGLIATTTKATIDPELETRVLSPVTDETEAAASSNS